MAGLLFGGKTMRVIFGGNRKVWEGLLGFVGRRDWGRQLRKSLSGRLEGHLSYLGRG